MLVIFFFFDFSQNWNVDRNEKQNIKQYDFFIEAIHSAVL